MNKPGLKDLVVLRQSIQDQIELSRTSLADVESQIEAIIDETLNHVRTIQGKDTGMVTIVIDEVEVKQDVPKRVSWDQEKIQGIREKIITAEDNPDLYMSTKFNISEKIYNGFAPAIKTIFMAARTIKAGKAKLTFNIKEV